MYLRGICTEVQVFKEASGIRFLQDEVVMHLKGMLGIELKSSRKAVQALNH